MGDLIKFESVKTFFSYFCYTFAAIKLSVIPVLQLITRITGYLPLIEK